MIKTDRKPQIGVCGPEKGGLSAWLFTWLALRRAGASALRITPGRDVSIHRLDGLVLGGGADVDPALYGAPSVVPSPDPPAAEASWRRRTLHWLWLPFYALLSLLRRLLSKKQADALDRGRDRLELRLIQEACKNDLPLLGICRGAQLLNVFFGGNLHQDIAGFYVEKPNVRSVRPGKRVRVAAGSLLAEILQTESCPVNALNHQAIKDVGQGLRIVAREEVTQVVQAIEHPERPFLLGVQWHPEFLPQFRRHQRIFRALVRHADGRMLAKAQGRTAEKS